AWQMNAYSRHIGKTMAAASLHPIEPLLTSTSVNRAAIGSQAARYSRVRVRFANIGCMSVRHFDAAHDYRTANHKSLCPFLRRLSRVFITAKDGIDLTDNCPIGGHAHFDSTPHRKDFEHRLMGYRDRCRA